jgi:UDP-N-acetylglucosamine acyltransferase
VSPREAGNYGVNTIGLERKGFSPESIKTIRAAFRVIQQSKLNATEALAVLKERFSGDADVQPIIEFIEQSERGVIK